MFVAASSAIAKRQANDRRASCMATTRAASARSAGLRCYRRDDGRWISTIARHWNLDRAGSTVAAWPVTDTIRRDHRVVVVGGGFAGLQRRARAARRAGRGDARRPPELHLFQPLAYQVATGALSPAEIAAPLRSVCKRQPNARVLLAEVTGFDLERASSSSGT